MYVKPVNRYPGWPNAAEVAEGFNREAREERARLDREHAATLRGLKEIERHLPPRAALPAQRDEDCKRAAAGCLIPSSHECTTTCVAFAPSARARATAPATPATSGRWSALGYRVRADLSESARAKLAQARDLCADVLGDGEANLTDDERAQVTTARDELAKVLGEPERATGNVHAFYRQRNQRGATRR